MTELTASMPYGSWPSPITAETLTAGVRGLSEIASDEGRLFWLESRPWEQGRAVVVAQGAAGPVDVTPPPYNVRTRVHEYGGAAWTVADTELYFVHMEDQRLYRIKLPALDDAAAETKPRPRNTADKAALATGSDRAAVPLTASGPRRFADLVLDRARGRLIAVCEDHSRSDREAVNSLVAIDIPAEPAQPGVDWPLVEPRTLTAGYDFYAAPSLSPDGRHLAWLCWNHPAMPWDATELWVAETDEAGGLVAPRRLVGGTDESVLQPRWSPDGRLFFVSDRSGWWNLYQLPAGRLEEAAAADAAAVWPLEAEFGRPAWNFGQATYGFSDGGLVCTYRRAGVDRVALLRPLSGDPPRYEATDLDLPFTVCEQLVAAGNRFAILAAASDRPAAVVTCAVESDAPDQSAESRPLLRQTVLCQSFDLAALGIDPAYVSQPQAITFPTTEGDEAHALFYAPRHPTVLGLASERPPLIVVSHGGPTSNALAACNLSLQYWTTRGFAVVDVDYRGSTGYGRAYRNRLRGNWGLFDVDDCVAAAAWLAAQGKVDAARTAIRGGSAGGFTTLAALTMRDAFQAGASYYGVSDLEALARDTHKFESRYLDGLVGPYPEQRQRYRDRSPIDHVDGLSCPVIFLQGLEDHVVPPDQAERMFQALQHKGVATELLEFPGEGHGFRMAASIRRATEAEYAFYARVFGFSPVFGVATTQTEAVRGSAGDDEKGESAAAAAAEDPS